MTGLDIEGGIGGGGQIREPLLGSLTRNNPSQEGHIESHDVKLGTINSDSEIKFHRNLGERISDLFSNMRRSFLGSAETSIKAQHQDARDQMKQEIHVKSFANLAKMQDRFPTGAKLEECIRTGVTDSSIGKIAEKDLKNKVETLTTLLQSKIRPERAKHAMHRAIGILYKIFDSKVYQNMKTDEGNKLVGALHDLAENFYFDMGGTKDYKGYVESLAAQTKDNGLSMPDVNASLKDGATRLESMYDQTQKSYQTKDKTSSKMKYFFTHLSRTKGSALGEKAGGTFDPFMIGNHTMTSGTYQYSTNNETRSVVHAYTPSMVLNDRPNPIALAMMQRLQNRQEYQNTPGEWSGSNPVDGGMTHLEISTLQALTTHHKGEKARSDVTLDLAKKFPGVVSVQGWDFDHANFNGKLTQSESFTTAFNAEKAKLDPKNEGKNSQMIVSNTVKKVLTDSFFTSVGTNNKGEEIFAFQSRDKVGETGMYFPDLSKEEMGRAIDAAHTLCLNASKGTWSDLQDDELKLRRQAQLFGQAVAVFADMISQNKKINEDGIEKMGKVQMCKQNVDRGAVANAMAKILHTTKMMKSCYDSTTNDVTNKEKLKELQTLRQQAVEEAVIGRGPAVDNRGVMIKRLNILTDFMHACVPSFNANSNQHLAAIIDQALGNKKNLTSTNYLPFDA